MEADKNNADTIVVTGTRRTDRTVTESAVPIDVFTTQDLKTQPSPQLQTMLRYSRKLASLNRRIRFSPSSTASACTVRRSCR